MGHALTTAQREQIVMFSNCGLLIRDIVREVGVSKSSVHHVLRRAGFRTNHPIEIPRETEREIRTLLRAGHGEPSIARELGLPGHIVHRAMKKIGFRRRPGSIGYKRSPEEVRRIFRRMNQRDKQTAQEFGCSRLYLNRLRRELAEHHRAGRRAA